MTILHSRFPGCSFPASPPTGRDVPSPRAALLACSLLLGAGMGARGEGITLNQLLNSSSSILKGGKRCPGLGFAGFVSRPHPSPVTAASLLSMGVVGSTDCTLQAPVPASRSAFLTAGCASSRAKD